MFALYFEAAAAAARAELLLLVCLSWRGSGRRSRTSSWGRPLHNNDMYNKQGVCRPFILSVALDDVVDVAELITQH